MKGERQEPGADEDFDFGLCAPRIHGKSGIGKHTPLKRCSWDEILHRSDVEVSSSWPGDGIAKGNTFTHTHGWEKSRKANIWNWPSGCCPEKEKEKEKVKVKAKVKVKVIVTMGVIVNVEVKVNVKVKVKVKCAEEEARPYAKGSSSGSTTASAARYVPQAQPNEQGLPQRLELKGWVMNQNLRDEQGMTENETCEY